MPWTCPECGSLIKEIRKYPVRCCSTVDYGNGTVETKSFTDDHLEAARKEHDRTAAIIPLVNSPTGVGTEMEKLFSELGAQIAGCSDCKYLKAEMNAWGVDGCREHRGEIVRRLRKKYKRARLVDKLR